jgi:hypothetical protein
MAVRSSSLRQKLSLSKQSHERDQGRRDQGESSSKVHGRSVGSDAVVGASACFQNVARDRRSLIAIVSVSSYSSVMVGLTNV